VTLNTHAQGLRLSCIGALVSVTKSAANVAAALLFLPVFSYCVTFLKLYRFSVRVLAPSPRVQIFLYLSISYLRFMGKRT
jgi:hypothetical protein